MRKATLIALGALTLTFSTASPAMAETVQECTERVIRDCDRALADSNWFEKVAVGIVCSGMYLACGGVNVNIKIL
jgi:hypothetical protein